MDKAKFLRLFSMRALAVAFIGAAVLVGVGCGGGEVALTPDVAVDGRELFSDLGCIACHKINGQGGEVGPSMVGLFGSERELTTGERITVDHDYLDESIEDPNAKMVKGYPAGAMPKLNFNHEQIDALIDFIKSLAE